MEPFSDSAHWRDSARTARFFIVDARAAFPLLLFLLHIRWWTFWVALVTMFFFAMLERYGFTLPIFFRFARSFLAGRYKSAAPWWRL
jgi:intracellular multiplication protein IcmT